MHSVMGLSARGPTWGSKPALWGFTACTEAGSTSLLVRFSEPVVADWNGGQPLKVTVGPVGHPVACSSDGSPANGTSVKVVPFVCPVPATTDEIGVQISAGIASMVGTGVDE